MNEEISAFRLLKVEGSDMRVLTVLGAIVLVLITANEAISACRFLNVEGSDMLVSTVVREEETRPSWNSKLGGLISRSPQFQ